MSNTEDTQVQVQVPTNTEVVNPAPVVTKRGRGRPPGSKNKVKKSTVQ